MTLSLTQFAKAGFSDLSTAREEVENLSGVVGVTAEFLLGVLSSAADPDRALFWLRRISQTSPKHLISIKNILDSRDSAVRLALVLGASRGLAEFIERFEPALKLFLKEPLLPQDQQHSFDKLSANFDPHSENARDQLRISYRLLMLEIALWDLSCDNPQEEIPQVSAALADIAGATLECGLQIAKSELKSSFGEEEIAAVDFAIIAMGKCGARELNYLSDVDVIYVGQPSQSHDISNEKALTIATRLAQHTARAIMEHSKEPGLWEVDANLRPEGKDGALVRTLDSHLTYYERWAKDWEFQALLKARFVAGSRDLGQQYIQGVAPKVWSSANRSDFVEQVQHMRERVTAHIPDEEVDFQIKLGPGGLRDVEFTVQLLQLVHGLSDESLHTQSTLESLKKLTDGGYVGRDEAESFARGYEFLRLLEHRLQLRNLSRTHLMPQDEEEQRILARSTGLFTTAKDVVSAWQRTKLEVRELHEKLFYRPLLAAVAKLPEETHQLTSDQAQARLQAIGFTDPKGALNHIAALTSGVSRRASIQRALLPVMLQWLSEGASPDHGLLTFRILSEKLGESHWFLRMLRDSAGAAKRLTYVLSGSRYVARLMELIPEAAAWFDDENDLRPVSQENLLAEIDAIITRHPGDVEASRKAVRALRRREVLRLAIASILKVINIEEIGYGLSSVTTAALYGYLRISLSDEEINPEMAIIALGRYGGRELGFDSDADIVYVYRPTPECDGEAAQKRAEQIILRIKELSEDPRLPFEIDTDLRPEGKKGPIARSLDSYRAYYERWSELWEAQALLRARPATGSPGLLEDVINLVNQVRYPEDFAEENLREIRRIKARVEAERLPQGADPLRHVKLGRGSLSDVEWTAQLLQLINGRKLPALQTTSTLDAIRAAADAKLISFEDSNRLIDAWIFASRVRSAITIWADRATDVLPVDFHDLEGIARLMGYPAGSASRLEEDYLVITRRCRQVVEKVFFGF